eukprot:gene12356-6024_t
MKDKKEVLTHRDCKKHFDVIRFLYFCDVCDENILLNKEGSIRAHKDKHHYKCVLKTVFYQDFKRTDITWVTNAKRINGKKFRAAVVRQPVMYNKNTETYEPIVETTVRQQKTYKKKELQK